MAPGILGPGVRDTRVYIGYTQARGAGIPGTRAQRGIRVHPGPGYPQYPNPGYSRVPGIRGRSRVCPDPRYPMVPSVPGTSNADSPRMQEPATSCSDPRAGTVSAAVRERGSGGGGHPHMNSSCNTTTATLFAASSRQPREIRQSAGACRLGTRKPTKSRPCSESSPHTV